MNIPANERNLYPMEAWRLTVTLPALISELAVHHRRNLKAGYSVEWYLMSDMDEGMDSWLYAKLVHVSVIQKRLNPRKKNNAIRLLCMHLHWTREVCKKRELTAAAPWVNPLLCHRQANHGRRQGQIICGSQLAPKARLVLNSGSQLPVFVAVA